MLTQSSDPAGIEQQPTQPISTYSSSVVYSRKVLRYSILASLYLALLIVALIGRTALISWFSAVITPSSSQSGPGIVIIHPRSNPAHSSQIDLATGQFVQVLMHKDWAALWSMLAPDAQRLYAGESDFVRVEQARYSAVTFVNESVSQANFVQPWLDPDTTRVYPLASVARISLQATAAPGKLSSLSIADLQHGLLQNLPFAMIPRNGQWQVIIAGPADLDAPILVPATLPAVKVLVPIFMYHHISNLPTFNPLDYSLTVTTTDFDAQLDWLQQQGYTSINMTELFDTLYYGKALPAHPMILSFDDGYKDVYTDALPALLAHHYRGVFFIITGMIGGRYMTWNQVRILQDEGMQIASHTIHHVNIGRPPFYTTTQNELTVSKSTLQTQLGQPIQFFCYPTGEPFHHDSLAEQQLVLADLYNDSYIGATLDPFSFDSAIQNAQQPYQLPRIRVSGGEPLAAYTGILSTVLMYDARLLSIQQS